MSFRAPGLPPVMDTEAPLRALRDARSERLEQLLAYLRLPSISSDPDGHADMDRCAAHTAELLRWAGMEQVTRHATPGHPLVVGSWRKAPGRPTVLIYGHYDVQPVDPVEQWTAPPFAPRLADDRVYARGAADDKGQVLMHIQAVAAILRAYGTLPVNVVFLIEGEEEIGSPNLPAFLESHRQELAADIALVSDSSMWCEGVPAITTSLRGLVLLDVTVTGPERDLHSGSFGGAVANPLEVFARLLGRVKGDDGVVAIPGFYDRVREFSREDRERLAALPFNERDYFDQLGLSRGWGEGGYSALERLWLRPTFEINGLWGGYSGAGAKTVLPSKAHAKISLRLVPDQEPDEMVALVTDYLRRQAPPTVHVEVSRIPGGGHPAVVPEDFPALGAARRALRECFGAEPLLVGEGGSIPVVADFERLLDLKTLLIGFSLPDAKPHAPDENMHLPTFLQGTEGLVRLLGYL